MNAEQMMVQLRRIVGAQMENWQRVQASSPNMKSPKGAYMLGQCSVYSSILDELSMTFNIDPWTCVKEDK